MRFQFADMGRLRPGPVANQFGITPSDITGGVRFLYETLDAIDEKLTAGGGAHLAELLELANLSAIVGNLFRAGLVNSSAGRFGSNTPHTYPDVLGLLPQATAFEIKVALENNKPKGHLIKPGPHLTLRYVLGGRDGNYQRGKQFRGETVWIWEIRVGMLLEAHFNFSNTVGDSGKTAVINAGGMAALEPVYFDRQRCPLSPQGANFKQLCEQFDPSTR